MGFRTNQVALGMALLAATTAGRARADGGTSGGVTGGSYDCGATQPVPCDTPAGNYCCAQSQPYCCPNFTCSADPSCGVGTGGTVGTSASGTGGVSGSSGGTGTGGNAGTAASSTTTGSSGGSIGSSTSGGTGASTSGTGTGTGTGGQGSVTETSCPFDAPDACGGNLCCGDPSPWCCADDQGDLYCSTDSNCGAPYVDSGDYGGGDEVSCASAGASGLGLVASLLAVLGFVAAQRRRQRR